MTANEVALSYLAASVLFILALRGLSHPRTARRGNLLGMVGMALAIVTTFAITNRIDMARLGIGIGAVVGLIVSRRCSSRLRSSTIPPHSPSMFLFLAATGWNCLSAPPLVPSPFRDPSSRSA